MASETMSAARVSSSDPFGLNGRVAIVTGAGQGIGRAYAKAFAANGATVIVAELNEQKAVSVETEITSAGGKAVAIHTDVGDPQSVERMAAQVTKEHGRIDILINNAAIFSTIKMRPFEQIPLDEWDQVMRTNITSAFLCARAVVPSMRKAQFGRIINISSGTVRVGRGNYLHYVTSKGAVVGMTRSLARELGPAGITVNALQPSATFTEIERETVTPAAKVQIIASQCIPRAEVPEDIVGTVLFLCSQHAEFITGQTIAVDGGASFR